MAADVERDAPPTGALTWRSVDGSAIAASTSFGGSAIPSIAVSPNSSMSSRRCGRATRGGRARSRRRGRGARTETEAHVRLALDEAVAVEREEDVAERALGDAERAGELGNPLRAPSLGERAEGARGFLHRRDRSDARTTHHTRTPDDTLPGRPALDSLAPGMVAVTPRPIPAARPAEDATGRRDQPERPAEEWSIAAETLPPHETWSADERRAAQAARLTAGLPDVLAGNPFYRAKLAAAGIRDAREITGSWAAVPFDEDRALRHQAAHQPGRTSRTHRRYVRYHQTSGTTALRILDTAASWAWWMEAGPTSTAPQRSPPPTGCSSASVRSVRELCGVRWREHRR